MADDLRNQDKPGYLNEPEHDYLQNNINAERAGSSAPTASTSTQPSENKVDYTQVSGMNTGSQAQSSNKTDSTNGEKTYLQNNINAERADSSTPTASALPSENNVDYNQVSGMDTGSQAQLSRETESTYGEETAAEIAAPVSLGRDRQSEADNDQETMKARSGIIGISALVISILSLFVLPIVLGITGVVLGFVARKRGGAKGLANWAIGIGAISIIIGMFVLPFY